MNVHGVDKVKGLIFRERKHECMTLEERTKSDLFKKKKRKEKRSDRVSNWKYLLDLYIKRPNGKLLFTQLFSGKLNAK